jgi:hypothetical protein
LLHARLRLQQVRVSSGPQSLQHNPTLGIHRIDRPIFGMSIRTRYSEMDLYQPLPWGEPKAKV